MTQAPSHQTVVVNAPESTSGIAIAGLIFNCLGWLTCGILSLIGVPLCVLALGAKGPKGAAIAGLIVGFPGVLFFVFAGFSMAAAAIGFGNAAAKFEEARRQAEQKNGAIVASSETSSKNEAKSNSTPTNSNDFDESRVTETPSLELPSQTTSEKTPAESTTPTVSPEAKLPPKEDPVEKPVDPKTLPRTWKDRAGKFSTEATFRGIIGTDVMLRKSDGKDVKVPIVKLSDEDQQWLQDNTSWKPTAASP